MTLVAKSDVSTGNSSCISQVVQSNDITFVITAPQAPHMVRDDSECSLPGYSNSAAFDFVRKHGLAVRSIGTVTPPTICYSL
jgi:4-hydroxyphenylpyruvate dioxygenase